MTGREGMIRHHAARLVALAVILVLYGLARLPELSGAERGRLAGRFGFVRRALPELPGDLSRTIRPVHPSLKKIEAWISSVGAAVAELLPAAQKRFDRWRHEQSGRPVGRPQARFVAHRIRRPFAANSAADARIQLSAIRC